MFERIIIVTKKTALEELLIRHHSRGQARFFLDRRGTSIDEYEAAHAAYRSALELTVGSLPRELAREVLPRELIPNFLFRETDLVIAIGPDGLAVNVAKYLACQPILAVNPDPGRIEGILMRFPAEAVGAKVREMLQGRFSVDEITLAEAVTNDGQRLLAVNDFLVGRRDTVSSRYSLTYRGETERQSSSGILIATGVGSTGWMMSLVTGARAVAEAMGYVREVAESPVPFGWSKRHLLFAIREPFPTKYTKTKLVFGRIEEGEELVITSEMSEGGAIFSDGVTEDAIEFNAGAIVQIGIANKVARLVART